MEHNFELNIIFLYRFSKLIRSLLLAFSFLAFYLTLTMLPGIFIVLFFFALGELVGWLVNGFIPGSVIGMMLLFTALCLKWVKPERIKPVARFLCDNMALFFVPAGVGIVNALDILSQYWQAVLVACAVSTVMVIVVVASIQQWFEKHRKGAEDR